jgi:hypothetical protein
MEAADPNELAEAEEMAKHLAKLEEKVKRKERSMRRKMTSTKLSLGGSKSRKELLGGSRQSSCRDSNSSSGSPSQRQDSKKKDAKSEDALGESAYSVFESKLPEIARWL